MIINTNIFDDIKDLVKRKDDIASWMTGKLISYIVNAFISILFLVYISLARFRIKIGYVFILLWMTMFVALSVGMHVLPGAHDEIIRLISGIIGTIAASFIIIVLLWMAKEVFIWRRVKRREMYRNYKKKGRVV